VSGDPAGTTVRVLTWNLWWLFGEWDRRRPAIETVLREASPDVCTVQEIWAGDGHHYASVLADLLGMCWAWAPSPCPGRWQRRLGRADVDIGNAILSRWPISETAARHLPAHGERGDEGRTVLFALIDAPHGPIPMFTTQLNSGPDESAVRCAQVRSVAGFVAAHRTGTFPAILAGDFNAQPGSDEIRLMEGHLTAPAVPGLLLIDSWRYADPLDPGHTWDRRNPYVAATMEPGARIDYVFVEPPTSDGLGHILDVRLVGDRPVNGVWPSDHAGIIVDLQAEPRPCP
jgi:endonuclease/exonuclease/phosphatase family metal-dependent hydrolase